MDAVRIRHRGEEWEISWGPEPGLGFEKLDDATAFLSGFLGDKRSLGRLRRVLELYDPGTRADRLKEDALVSALAALLHRGKIRVIEDLPSNVTLA